MHPSVHARTDPDRIAYRIVPSGEVVTYGELDARSNQAAHLFRSLGLRRGDVVAILLENHARYYELAWAADRSGLYYTCLSTQLSATDVGRILADCGASILLTSRRMQPLAEQVRASAPAVRCYLVDGSADGFEDYLAARDGFPTVPVADESCGSSMLYSSGTTGRPKGVEVSLPEGPLDQVDQLTRIAVDHFGYEPGMVYLVPAPLYHSAPLRWSMLVHKVGGTVVVMPKFDALGALECIERYGITVSQWVPTHFVRMLKLPEADRKRFDLSTQKVVFHAAAPCPVEVKRRMMAWWGPILREFYAGTEFNGMTAITAEEWLAHPGSVGRPVFGELHICDDKGEPLPAGEEGLVYFGGGVRFRYRNDPQTTAAAYNAAGWSTLGDIGRVDADGYLYLTDRKGFLVISGGVNIYPREIEDVVVGHPDVADVAVIGAPDEDLGERLVAVVELLPGRERTPTLVDEIQAMVERDLGRLKVPRQVDVVDRLPRHATGKLYKRLLRDSYRESHEAGAHT
ncbi:acyl-CoA synthetase [Pseudonocardia sp. CA-107938]|uniref:acyl-CoA synthetase n=1 Tax=Pseudonocardia sp. CA-107938 TaxID=3240021 RepID=UPI003D8BEE94